MNFFTAFLFVAPANLFERRRKQKRWSAKPTFPDNNSLHGRRRQAGERRSARSARVNPREGEGSRSQAARSGIDAEPRLAGKNGGLGIVLPPEAAIKRVMIWLATDC